MIFVYGVVVGPGGTNICRVAGQTFPLLLLLNFLDVFPAQAPLETLVTERFRTEVTEIDLPTLAAPPKIISISGTGDYHYIFITEISIIKNIKGDLELSSSVFGSGNPRHRSRLRLRQIGSEPAQYTNIFHFEFLKKELLMQVFMDHIYRYKLLGTLLSHIL